MVKRLKRKKLTLSEQARLLKILGELLQKGYPLVQAVEFLTIQFPNTFRRSIDQSIQLLKEGNSFIDFAYYLELHTDVIIYLYYAEKHGDLPFALKEGSFMLTKKIQHKAYLRKVMSYPICLIVFLLLILFIFRLFILPQYEMLFSTFQTNTKSFAFTYLQIVKYAPNILFFIIFLFLCLTATYFLSIKKLNPVLRMKRMIRIPLFKKFLITSNTYEFSMQLSILLHAGFSIADALKIMQNNESRSFLKEKAKYFYEQILNGVPLQELLKNDEAYHRDLKFVIDHGMNNSSLSNELSDYAAFLKGAIEEIFHKSLQFIQPLILIIISTSILSIYVAILFPMFQLMNNF